MTILVVEDEFLVRDRGPMPRSASSNIAAKKTPQAIFGRPDGLSSKQTADAELLR
jgi:hypothetical protein